MRVSTIKLLLITLICVNLIPPSVRANDYDVIYNAYQSMVHVLAESGEVFNAGQKAIQDPETGKIYTLTDLVAAKQEKKGLGIIVNSAGLIATNLHIVSEANRITVTLHDQKQYNAVLVYQNSLKDIAILYIRPEKLLAQMAFADSDTAKIGGKIFTLGSVERTDNSVSMGRIVNVEPKEKAVDGSVNSIQVAFDFDMNLGDSGRPIFDESGKCIGMIAAGAEITRNHIYAIPSNMIVSEFWNFLNNTQNKN